MNNGQINLSAIGWTLLVIIACMVLVHAASFLMFAALDRAPSTQVSEAAFKRAVKYPNGPLLEESAVDNLKELRKHEEEVLNSYGWVDRSRGLVRIPVDRAMELMAGQQKPRQGTSP